MAIQTMTVNFAGLSVVVSVQRHQVEERPVRAESARLNNNEPRLIYRYPESVTETATYMTMRRL